jgi:hypothetical protein
MLKMRGQKNKMTTEKDQQLNNKNLIKKTVLLSLRGIRLSDSSLLTVVG